MCIVRNEVYEMGSVFAFISVKVEGEGVFGKTSYLNTLDKKMKFGPTVELEKNFYEYQNHLS